MGTLCGIMDAFDGMDSFLLGIPPPRARVWTIGMHDLRPLVVGVNGMNYHVVLIY